MKHISLNPHPKKAKNPSKTPLANLQGTHNSVKEPNLSHLACAANAAHAD